MAEIKKIASNPPSRLQNEIIALSVSKDWESAKKEWEVKWYFYDKGYRGCLCGPRGIHNICVIRNKLNFNEREICNSCVRLYLGLDAGVELEKCVRKIKANIEYNMSHSALMYLERNTVIDECERLNYEMVIGVRGNEEILSYRKKINRKMLLFTAYENKEIFEILDRILAFSFEQYESNINTIWDQRNEFLNTGEIDVKSLDDFIARFRVKDYSKEHIESVKKELNLKIKCKDFWLPYGYHHLQKRRPEPEWHKCYNHNCDENGFENTQFEQTEVSNDLQVDYPYNRFTNLWDEDEEEETELDRVIMDELTSDRTRSLCNIIYRWILSLIGPESNGLLSMDRILDFLDIPQLHEMHQQENPKNLYLLLVECGLDIAYTYEVLGILIERSNDDLRKENVKKINALLRKARLKLSCKNSSVSFALID